MGALTLAALLWFAGDSGDPSRVNDQSGNDQGQSHSQTKDTAAQNESAGDKQVDAVHTHNDAHRHDGNAKNYKEHNGGNVSDSHDVLDLLNFLIAFLLVGITALQAYTAFVSTRATKDAADAAKRSVDVAMQTIEEMRLERRAWLAFETPLLEPLMAGRPLRSTLAVKNCGRTPGTVVQQVASAIVVPTETEFGHLVAAIQQQLESAPAREIVVAPDSRMQFAAIHAEAVMTERLLLGLLNGELELFVVGLVRYLDSAGGLHTSQCCYGYHVESKAFWGYGKYNYMV
jgi:hypothetical protein